MMESTLVPNTSTNSPNPLFGDDDTKDTNSLFGSMHAADCAPSTRIPPSSAAPAAPPLTAPTSSNSAIGYSGNGGSTTSTTAPPQTKTSKVSDLMGQLLLGGTDDDDDDDDVGVEQVDPLFEPISHPPTTLTPFNTNPATTASLHPSSQTTSTSASAAVPTTTTTTATTKLLAESGLLEAVVPLSVSMPSSVEGGGGALFGDDDDDAIVGGDGNTGLFDEVDAEQEATKEEKNHFPEENAQHERNANDTTNTNGGQCYEGYDFGMGMMGVGGEIPKSPHPSSHQYSQFQQAGPQQVQQQQQQQQQYPSHQQQNQVGGVMNAMAGSYYYSTTGAGQMTQRGGWTPSSTKPTSAIPSSSSSSSPMMSPQPSIFAGMHVGHDVNLGGVAPQGAISSTPSSDRHHRLDGNHLPMAYYYIPPEPFEPHYGMVVVGDPMLIQGSGLFAGPPHWTYLVTVYAKNSGSGTNIQQQQQQQPISAVRRRFRHFVALEDRLRQSVPGAILPPRPDKHPTRAIEEASGRQSMDFARQRATELGEYMNALVHHPFAGPSSDLRLFLMLQDHIGTAWPEVSPSTLTRIAAVGSATVERLADAVDGALGAQQLAAGEDSAEILALAAREGRRIGAVSSSVPKVEGAVALVCDRGDKLGSTGMELSKLVKDVTWCDRDLTAPLEILAGAMLRGGRRTRRLGLEVGIAITPFVVQYRMCKYEQMAFADRRLALRRRTEARTRADQRAAKLMMNQTSMQSYGRLGTLERMETEAAMYDELAMEASKEADEIATRLQMEVGRIGTTRVEEWETSMKVIASEMKEGYAENASIWESALAAFQREFPDLS